jgi:hypothetical protein
MKKFLLLPAAAAAVILASACSGPAADTKPTASSITGFELNTVGAAERITTAGLEVLPAEATAEQYRAHLDVLWNGQAVPVPANIGISTGPDGKAEGFSAVHTHDDSGVIHVAAPATGGIYTLGQFLAEWGVLDGRDPAAGSGKATLDGWKVYVNGTKYEGVVKNMKINTNDEIALIFGKDPEPVPSSYTFPESK